MSVTSGPKIINDSLEFYYDMYNKKSNLGAYTVNLFPTSILSATNASMEITSYPFYNGIYNGWKTTGIANDNPRTYLYNSTLAVNASSFYSLSCLYWSSNNVVDDVYLKFSDTGWTESTYYIQPFTSQSVTRNGSFSIQDLGGGWKRCVGTFETLATTTTLQQLFFDNDVAGVEIFITNIQLESKNFASRYVNGSRTNTNVIRDISTPKNAVSVPSLSALTFNNDEINTFTFNGSNNYLTVSNTNYPASWNDSFSIEVWMKVPTGATWHDQTTFGSNNGTPIIGRGSYVGSHGLGRNSTDTVFFMVRTDSGLYFANSSGTARDTWYHFIGVYDTNTVKLYRNGELISSTAVTKTGSPGTGTWAVGGNMAFGGNNGGYGAGDYQSMKIYNRALSATEILNNFNAHKSKYGL